MGKKNKKNIDLRGTDASFERLEPTDLIKLKPTKPKLPGDDDETTGIAVYGAGCATSGT